jgi:AraC family transcriptional regulator
MPPVQPDAIKGCSTADVPHTARARAGAPAALARVDRPGGSVSESATVASTVPGMFSPTARHKSRAYRIPDVALWRLPAGMRAATLRALLDALKRDPVDEAIMHCSRALEWSLSAAKPPSYAFVDHLLQAVAAHHDARSGRGGGGLARIPRGGLAPWQQRRVTALMTANLATGLSLKRLASECDLSVTQFARAFRQSMGKPPHHWLLDRRLEKSLSMLAESRVSLCEIASSCGFADQSHFTRIFAKKIGMAPSAWRRFHGTGPRWRRSMRP